VSETQATSPVFPPGRYGRRRTPTRTPKWVGTVLVVVVAVVAAGLAWRLWRQYGDPVYETQVTRVTDVTADGVTIEFTVTVPTGGSALCTVRARATDGREVGRAEVPVAGQPGERRVTAVYRLATSGLPRTAEVPGCGPQDR
jgi:Domain of unknown function (DUF4307)